MSPCSRSPNPPACGCRPRRRDDCASCCASLSHGGYSSYRTRADNWRGRGRPVRLRANKPSYCSVAHAKPHRAAAAQSGVSCITSRGQWKHIYDRATSLSPSHTSSQQSRDAAAVSTASDGSTVITGMIIEFTKMQGLGNDFVVIDATAHPFSLEPPQIARLADRHFGVGCDQVLLVEAPRCPGTDFRYRIFNADGGEVEQCGNGARCFVRYVRERGLTDKTEIVVETAGGIIRPRIEADGRVSVAIGAVSMGNPHAVLQVNAVADAPVTELGPLLERHPRFPKRVNVGFMEIVDRGHIRLRVYERGAGETLACGTGACAAAAIGQRWGLLDSDVAVDLPGGRLTIKWHGTDHPVWMTGPAERVFEGRIEL